MKKLFHMPEDFKPTLWWTAEKNVQTVDDLFKEISRRAPEAAGLVRVVYLIGAHKFQEHTLFIEQFPNLEQIYLFEPIPDFSKYLEQLTAHLGYVRVFPYAVTDYDGKADFFVTNNYESSSLFKLEKHKTAYPHVYESGTIEVQCRRLDTVINTHGIRLPDILFIDVQGAEYKVISSIGDPVLRQVKLIYTEASTIEFYKGARNLGDVQDYLDKYFHFVGFSPQDNRVRNHGNALFFNRDMISMLPGAPGGDQKNCQGDKPAVISEDTCKQGFTDYSFDEMAIRSFWQTQESRFDAYLGRCKMDNSGYIARDYRITVLVSSYESENFVDECLNDLVNQVTAGETEIVFVDAHSPQGEGEIVRRFQGRYGNIRYVRTPERIGIYAAWNLAARLARGKYLTTFSTNDRIRTDAHQLLSSALDDNPRVMMVYGDTLITRIPHENFYNYTIPDSGKRELKWPPYDFMTLLNSCMIGPNPMWRREVHEHIGYWDERFQALGDQDFFLRVGEKHEMLHINHYTGLYWRSDDAVSAKGWTPRVEDALIRMRYWHRYELRMGKPPYPLPDRESAANCETLFKSGIDSLRNGNLQDSYKIFSRILEIYPNHSGAIKSLGKLLVLWGHKEQALYKFINAAVINSHDLEAIKLMIFYSCRAQLASVIVPLVQETLKINKSDELLCFVRNLDAMRDRISH